MKENPDWNKICGKLCALEKSLSLQPVNRMFYFISEFLTASGGTIKLNLFGWVVEKEIKIFFRHCCWKI